MRKFVNTAEFSREAQYFTKHGVYPFSPNDNSKDAKEYWGEQTRRCLEGYSVGGVKVDPRHYFYLNFLQIKAKDKNTRRKGKFFPDWWDSDYEYQHIVNIARNGITKEELDKLELDVKINHLDGDKHLIIGKEQPYSSKIKTPDGNVSMEDVRVGDVVLTPSGTAKVIDKIEQGLKDVYELTLYSGRKVRAGKDHLWKLFSAIHRKNHRAKYLMTTEELLNKPLKVGVKYKYFIQNITPAQHTKKDLPIHPYLLGLLLGDGKITKGNLKLASNDLEIVEWVTNHLPDFNIVKEGDFYYRLSIKDKFQYCNCPNYKFGCNPIKGELKKLGLWGKNCHTKFIPDLYKYSDEEDRLEIIRGLLDTDGSINQQGDISYASICNKLTADVSEVLHSLGIMNTMSQKGDGMYRVYACTNKPVFRLTRKLKRIRVDKSHRDFDAVVDIKKLEYKEKSACITVDTEDALYLTENYITTHNCRRRGYSYKNAAIVTWHYNFLKNSTCLLGAYEAKYLYPKGTMSMVGDYMDFLNEHTAWRKRREYLDRKDHKKASYKLEVGGSFIEKGYKSEVIALTFKDNPDASRGKDADLILFEEAGKFPGLINSYNASRPVVEDGDFVTGQILVFGTGGDMERGTLDFAEMFYDPDSYGALAVENIWDEDAEGTFCSFFVPDYKNKVGFIDEYGNSLIEDAKANRLEIIEGLSKGKKGSSATDSFVQEFPISPSEGFLIGSSNMFPVVELRAQLSRVKNNKALSNKGIPFNLYYEAGRVKGTPDLEGKLRPITTYPYTSTDTEGAVVVYEPPIATRVNGLYSISYDSYSQEQGTSLAAMIVYKTADDFSYSSDMIVAEYIGRPDDPDDCHRIAEMLAEWYGCQILAENMGLDVQNYFKRRRKLHLLAFQPDDVIKKVVQRSKVSRTYGIHMSKELKSAGIKFIKSWLLAERSVDEDGNKTLNLNMIYSTRLLEELIKFDPMKGNYDMVSAFIVTMFALQQREEGEVVKRSTYTPALDQFKEIMSSLTNRHANVNF